jgi:hypothetical protein
MQNYFFESLVGLTAQLSQLYLQPGEQTDKASSAGRPIGRHSTYRLFIMGVTVPKGRALMCRFRPANSARTSINYTNDMQVQNIWIAKDNSPHSL